MHAPAPGAFSYSHSPLGNQRVPLPLSSLERNTSQTILNPGRLTGSIIKSTFQSQQLFGVCYRARVTSRHQSHLLKCHYHSSTLHYVHVLLSETFAGGCLGVVPSCPWISHFILELQLVYDRVLWEGMTCSYCSDLVRITFTSTLTKKQLKVDTRKEKSLARNNTIYLLTFYLFTYLRKCQAGFVAQAGSESQVLGFQVCCKKEQQSASCCLTPGQFYLK